MTSVFGPGSPPIVETPDGGTIDCDIVIIGSGMGGSTLANAISRTGAKVLVVERGDFLPRESANWSPVEVFQQNRYKNAEMWYDGATGKPFKPGVHYYVGGNTKVYGACLPRFRAQDFEEIKHHDGISPAWPVSYSDMEPFYGEAERMYGVSLAPPVTGEANPQHPVAAVQGIQQAAHPRGRNRQHPDLPAGDSAPPP